MRYLQVKNWKKFQHYKHRRPPWIKLHRSVLDDVEFSCLQDDSKLHLILIWLLASQNDNKIPDDEAWLTKKFMLKKQVALKPLINSGFLKYDSKMIAPCLQSADSESEIRDQSSETEKNKKAPTAPFVHPDPQEVMEYGKSIGFELDGHAFCDHYESRGWKYKGGLAMKDWKAAVRTWKRNQVAPQSAPAGQRKPFPGETMKLLAEARSQKETYWSRRARMGSHGSEIMPLEHAAEWEKIKARVKELERTI